MKLLDKLDMKVKGRIVSPISIVWFRIIPYLPVKPSWPPLHLLLAEEDQSCANPYVSLTGLCLITSISETFHTQSLNSLSQYHIPSLL